MRSAELHRCLARFAKFIPSTVPQPFTDGRQLGNREICATPKTPPDSERATATPDVNTQTWSCLPSTYTSSPRGARAPLPPSHSPEQRFVPPVHSGNGGQTTASARARLHVHGQCMGLPVLHPHPPLTTRRPLPLSPSHSSQTNNSCTKVLRASMHVSAHC